MVGIIITGHSNFATGIAQCSETGCRTTEKSGNSRFPGYLFNRRVEDKVNRGFRQIRRM